MSLYFADPTGRWLVPDLRWFPELDPTPTPTATLVVKAMLAGAAPWLGQIGETAGARLTAVPGVQIDGGVAHVDLDHSVYDATKQKPERRRVLVAELQATLQDLVGTSQVVLTSDQAKLEVPDGPVPMVWTAPTTATSAQLGRATAPVSRDRTSWARPASSHRCV